MNDGKYWLIWGKSLYSDAENLLQYHGDLSVMPGDIVDVDGTLFSAEECCFVRKGEDYERFIFRLWDDDEPMEVTGVYRKVWANAI